MVVGVLGALAAMTKVRYSSTAVDSHVFRLHYRWTTTFCFACCALVMAKEYVGDAIECIVKNSDLKKQMTTYCWISSTFTINSTNHPIPGVGPYHERLHEQKFHSYYQWVSTVLFIQGCLFYLPHLVWKWFEGKHVDYLLQDLNKGLFDEDKNMKIKNIISYVRESWGLNNIYATVYHLCEAINFTNVIIQMFVLDSFLGGVFMNYGPKVLSLVGMSEGERNDHLATTFPKLTKCQFKKYGGSGTIENYDALCVLAQNIINEKIFLGMWFWFVILAVITGGWLIWRCILLSVPVIRRRLLEHLAEDKLTGKTENTINSLHLGDFCLLEHIGYNLDIISYREVLRGVTDAVEEYVPSAPVDNGTYKRFHDTNAVNYDTFPKEKVPRVVDTSL